MLEKSNFPDSRSCKSFETYICNGFFFHLPLNCCWSIGVRIQEIKWLIEKLSIHRLNNSIKRRIFRFESGENRNKNEILSGNRNRLWAFIVRISECEHMRFSSRWNESVLMKIELSNIFSAGLCWIKLNQNWLSVRMHRNINKFHHKRVINGIHFKLAAGSFDWGSNFVVKYKQSAKAEIDFIQ